MSFGHFVEVMWDVNVFFQTTYRGHHCPYSFVRLFCFITGSPWAYLDIPDVLALDNILVLIMLYSSTPEEFSDICYRSTGNQYK